MATSPLTLRLGKAGVHFRSLFWNSCSCKKIRTFTQTTPQIFKTSQNYGKYSSSPVFYQFRHYSSDKKPLTGLASTPSSSTPKDKQGPFAAFMNLPKKDESQKTRQQIFGDDEDWITIYRFSHIATARVIQRFKIYQTAFSCFIALPIGFFSMIRGIIPVDTFSIIVFGGGFACCMLFVMGNLFSNLVGIIYVTDKDPEIVRIAHMTFWGTREDELYKKMDFIPFGDLPDNLQDAYVKLRLYSDPDHVLKITLKYGTIFDDARFFEVFGNCPDLIVKKKTKEDGTGKEDN